MKRFIVKDDYVGPEDYEKWLNKNAPKGYRLVTAIHHDGDSTEWTHFVFEHDGDGGSR